MQITPAPLPAVVTVEQVQVMQMTAAGPVPSRQVRVKIQDMTGERVVFFSPESAVNVGEQLVAAGRAGGSGLLLPPGTRMPVDVPDDVQAAADELAERHQPQNRQQRRQAEREAARAAKSSPEPGPVPHPVEPGAFH